jgi:DNA-binding MarR family transcriptional regulator
MTRVNPHDLPPVPEWVDLHAVALSGRLIEEVRATFAAEDWGGLRQSHFRFLSYVPPGGISVTELAVLLGMTKQAAGQFVTQMEGTGHLETRTDPGDRRVRLVARTALGDRTVKTAVARIRRIERAWARRVGAERYEKFREVLTDIALPGGRAG